MSHFTYSVLTLLLSVLSISILLGDMLFIADPAISAVIQRMDAALCFFFFLDFAYMLYTAENKWRYLYTWGWLDLLSCIPMIDQFRSTRIARIYKLIRIIRAFRATQIVVNTIVKHRTKNVFLSVAVLTLLMVGISSIAILVFENHTDSNIKSAEDAIWWSYVTITTVGYGDRYPVSTFGRILGGMLMTFGVGIFGIFSGYVASWFMQPSVDNDMKQVQSELAELRKLVEQMAVKNLEKSDN